MMTEHMKRFLSMLVEGLLAPAIRLARLAAVRHEVEAYTLAFDEADGAGKRGGPPSRNWPSYCSRSRAGRSSARRFRPPRRRSGRWTWTAITALSHWSRRARRSLAPQPTSRRANRNSRIPRAPRRRGRPPGSKKNQTKAAEDTKPGAAEASPEQPQPGVTLLWDANV